MKRKTVHVCGGTTKYVLDPDVIASSPLTIDDVLVLLLLRQHTQFMSVLTDLEKRGYVVRFQGECYVTPTSEEILKDLLLKAEKIENTDNLTKLAERLVTLFPEGKKPGTSFLWRCSVKECAMRLREFYKMFGKFPDNEIEDATQRYVDSFAGNYTLMRTLKYFIWKSEIRTGVPEYTSDLASWIENKPTNRTRQQSNKIITL